MSTIHSNDLPDFIIAESPRGLRLKMFKLNAGMGGSYRFFDMGSYVDKKGKVKHIAWFYRKLEDVGELDHAD